MVRYIAIDGKGGSGKTYLSTMLAKHLGAKVYHLDDYGNDYQPFVGIPKLVDELRKATGDIVLYEGVGVFDERFDIFRPFRILVQVPDVIRQRRATSRDVPSVGRSAEEWHKIWNIWSQAEHDYFNQSVIAKARCIVGAEDGNFAIARILSDFENVPLADV